MAEIQPLRALHYNSAVTGSLGDVVAPPYDVIDADQRAALLARSPFNVVAVDLPEGDPDPYESARDLFDSWQLQGVVVRDAEPAIWAHTQQYTGPAGGSLTRRGFFCRVRIEEYGAGRVRPHERTHPGPKEDRLRLTRATRTNLSPIFSLYSDPQGSAWGALEEFTSQPPTGEATDADGTVHRIWRVTDPHAIEAVQAATRQAELLIADGHHRYETARAYAQEIGGEGEHQYVLMCLVALEDPGLTVFPTHRLVKGVDRAHQEALRDALQRNFHITEVSADELAPSTGEGPLELGYIDAHHQQTYRLTLKDQSIASEALADRSDPYQHLDTGVLEALILKGALGLSDDDISHLHNFGYARDARQALELVRRGEFDAAFLMRPTPVQQVRDIAAAGENMPPKSTYFFPKLLTGLLFSPLF
ncbi:MAG TPA: DUF1015 domain-containing protein [Solirubrobacteraceae bacterium]|jgi:uncharacterized protein (DUF1015 family)